MSGSLHGKAALANAPVVPLKLTGLVATRSSIWAAAAPRTRAGTKTFKTPEGNLTVVVTAKPQTTQSLNAKTCRESFTQYVVASVVGGKSTGAFVGASGPAAVQVAFEEETPSPAERPLWQALCY